MLRSGNTDTWTEAAESWETGGVLGSGNPLRAKDVVAHFPQVIGSMR
jgi:hypothetical protein